VSKQNGVAEVRNGTLTGNSGGPEEQRFGGADKQGKHAESQTARAGVLKERLRGKGKTPTLQKVLGGKKQKEDQRPERGNGKMIAKIKSKTPVIRKRYIGSHNDRPSGR